jgi:hypothetical protein
MLKRLLNLEVILGLLCVAILVIATQDPFGWASHQPSKPSLSEAHCWKIPAKWGGRTYCSNEQEGGAHGYLNPGSNEWEVE